MNNLSRTERAVFNADFNRYFKAEEQAEKRRQSIADLIGYKTEEALNDETAFCTLDQNYEVIDPVQVMRALRSLDFAIRRFNALHTLAMIDIALIGGKDYEKRVKETENARIPIDAVFTALSNIKQRFDAAIAHEAEAETK